MPTILLADDSVTIQKIVNLTFSGEGIDVVTVGNGEAAVKKIHELRPALVLADICMPGKNGYEVCDHIKNDPSLSSTPVILLVGAFEPFDSNEAARIKADGHLTKPFEIKVLISAVNSLIAAPSPEPAAAAKPVPEASFVETPALEEKQAAATFASLSEATVIVPPVEPEPSSELSHPGPVPAVDEPIALGVDAKDSDLLALGSTEPAPGSVPVAAGEPAKAKLREPEGSAPSLSIEESDPLGLLAGEDVVATSREVSLEARSMVVDIWEPPPAVEAPAPVVSAESAKRVEEVTLEPAAVAVAPERIEVSTPTVAESVLEEPPAEPLAGDPIVLEPEPPTPIAAASGAAMAISDEVIERIATRVVEKLSREVIERIAWEVVPDLAELMLKEHVQAQLKESRQR